MAEADSSDKSDVFPTSQHCYGGFQLSVEINYIITLVKSVMGSKFSRHFFNQSEVKPKPIVARACTFSRALCRLRVITSSFDWFTGLSPSFLIGQSNYFWFWFYDTQLQLALEAFL